MSRNRTTDKPNIIWIMADDLSWADCGCFGQKYISTPAIDRIAREGMTFNACYSGNTVCAPSRSSLMQGLHQGHATVRSNMTRFEREGGEPGVYRHCLQPGDTTVAHVLKGAGYATGIFGKWGLAVGDQPGQPNEMGFDEFFGYLNQRKAHTYYPEQLWHNREVVAYPQHAGHNHRAANEYDEDGRVILNGVKSQEGLCYSFDEYARRGHEFVRDHADEPFFLYLAYTPPHGALEVPELGHYTDADFPTLTHKIWAAMITRMDAEIGKLLDLLDELGLAEDTLIFFVSDNGYSGRGYVDNPTLDEFFHHSGPWEGAKGNLYQGGLRVPALARWSGKIAAGSSSDLVWAFWDFLPTAADLSGAQIPNKCDGMSILPTLLGKDGQEGHEALYWEYGDAQSTRFGDYYAVRQHPDKPVEVYAAEGDPHAEKDISRETTDLVKRAEEIFAGSHDPSLYFRSPGESPAAWEARRRRAGIELDANVDTW